MERTGMIISSSLFSLAPKSAQAVRSLIRLDRLELRNVKLVNTGDMHVSFEEGRAGYVVKRSICEIRCARKES